MPSEWYVAHGGQQVGPFTEADIRQQAVSGAIGPDTLLWHDALSDWLPARDIPGLLAAGAIAPPKPAPLIAYAGRNMDSVILTPEAIEMLRQTRPWAWVMAVVLLVSAGLLTISGFVMLSEAMRFVRETVLAVFGLVCWGIASLMITAGVHLVRYALRIGRLVLAHRDEDLEEAMRAQKSFWKTAGMTTLIVIGIYASLFVYAFVSRW